MPNLAYTIVFNDFVILELWLKYYSRFFEDLFVIADDTNIDDPEFKRLLATYKFKFEWIPLEIDPSTLLGTVRAKQCEFLQDHEWVLYTNCDEYLVPSQYKDLGELMEKCELPYISCEAFDVFQDDGEKPIDFAKPYLKQRKYWFKNNSYNKTVLSRVPLEWVPGCHRTGNMSDEDQKNIKDTGLYLVHLKYADMDVVRDNLTYKREFEYDVLEKGKSERMEIPPKVRRAF